MQRPAPALNFPAACLTPLLDHDLRALQALTARWSPPDPARGTTTRTLGPAGYRRLRMRRTATVIGYVLVAMILIPSLVTLLAALTDDPAWHRGRMLTVLYGFFAGGIILSLIAGAFAWRVLGGRRRITAGAEPSTQLTFTATTAGLTITRGTGQRLGGAWSRWRLSNVRAEVVHLKYGRTYLFNSATLVLYPEDGSPTASAILEPITLENGPTASATIIAMICQSATPPAR